MPRHHQPSLRDVTTRATPVFLVIIVIALAGRARAGEYALYFLGGQSNMDGYGHVDELPIEQNANVDGAMIFHPTPTRDGAAPPPRGIWAPLGPGHGAGFSSDGGKNRTGERFGPELAFARRMRKLHPDRRVAIIKYSAGGTALSPHSPAAANPGHWDPDYKGGEGPAKGMNQYDYALAAIADATAFADIDGDGETDRLVPSGIVWMQGESDALAAASAEEYENNLKELMDLLRAALRQDDLPVAVGLISDSGQDEKDGRIWDFGETVRSAQRRFCDADAAAVLVAGTDDYGYSDPAHYDTVGFLDLGREFANALESLEAR